MSTLTLEILQKGMEAMLKPRPHYQPCISYKSCEMLEEIISEGFKCNLGGFISDSLIQFYYLNWKSHWNSYQTHGQGD